MGSNLQSVGAELLAAAVLLDIVIFSVKETELFCAVTKYKLLSTIRAALKRPILNIPTKLEERDRDFETRGSICTCGELKIKVPFIKYLQSG
jgi:hypothetical protein